MSSFSHDRLLARPLRHDRLVQLWLLAMVGLALRSLPTYVEWGGAPNAERVLGLAGLLLRVGFWLWLLLLIVPAFLRRGVRRRRTRQRRGGWWRAFWMWWHGSNQRPLRLRSSRRAAGWSTSTAAAPVGVGFHGSGAWPTVGPPTFRSASVRPRTVVSGHPVTVQWDAPLAEHVAVGELTGLPPAGSTQVVPQASGPLTLTAVNAYGTGSATTEPVTVGAAPRIDLAAVPVPPTAPPATAVPAAPPAPAARRLRLDDVLDRQRTRRASAPRPIAPGATPSAAPSLPNLSTDAASRRPC